MIGNLSKHKRNNDDTYRRSEIDLIVSNAKKSAVKYAEELAEKKLDKDENKGLSANDYTDSDKAEVAKVKDKVDKVSGKGLSTNDYTNAEKAEVAKVKDKVDKVSGKGLSTNDFTSAYKTKLDNLDTTLSAKVDKVTGKGLSKNDFTDDYKAKLDNLNTNISETLAGKADKTEVLTKTNTTVFTPTADYQPATKKYVDDLASNKGGGDMLKSAYDANKDGVVNDSDKLGGQLPSYYAQASDLTNKVDKVSGKGLSTNDFTDSYKTKLDNLDTNISETLAGKADKTEVLTKTNTTVFTPTADYQPATKKYVDDLASNKGGGDMLKSAYDANKDGVVNDSDKLGGQLPSYYAQASDLTNKVDKVSGKGLSTNDFTDSYKTKLDNLDTNTVETRSIDTVVINSTDWVELQDVLIKTKVLWNSGGSFESDLPGFSSTSTGYWIMSMYMGEVQGANGEVSYAFVQYVSGYDKRVELNADFVGGEVFARSLEISTNSSFADVNSRTVSGYSKWTCINPKTSSSNTVSLCQWHNGEFLGLGKFEGISSATAYSVTIPAGVSLVKITYGSHVPGDGNGTWNYNMVALRKNGTMIGFGGDYQGRYQYGVLGNSLNAQIVSVTSGDVLVLHSSDVKADNLLSYDPDKINEKFTTMPTACVPYCTMIVEAIE